MAKTFIPIKTLRRKLMAMPDEIKNDVQKAIDVGALEFANAARSATPHGQTGQLAKGIKVLDADAVKRGAAIEGAKHDAMRVRVENQTFYAPMVEHGHDMVNPKTGDLIGRVAKRDTFYPTWKSMKRRVNSRITRSITKAIKRVWF
ncbi:MAG: HK97 gp10 family phage protein [Rhizobiales bacterium]|nr:HK97 gp10 family phage protein [Hyphomicrobiales bacterium]NRB15040.1 HK97 gp10 family phage protein [Hyphomicrobiales bacterium]